MTDLIRWEIKTWGQVGASLLSLMTVFSALTGLWDMSHEYQGDVIEQASVDIVAGFSGPHRLADLHFTRP